MGDNISLGKKVAGFILTLILVPVIYIGTCFPLGASAKSGADGIILGYTAFFAAFLIYRAVKMKNVGVRVAIILIFIALATFLLSLYR